MTKSIEWALVLILGAAAIILNSLDLLQGISIIGVLITVLLVCVFIKGIIYRHFGKIFISAALIPYVCLRSNFIQDAGLAETIDKLTPFPLLISAIFLTIAFNILFKDKIGKHKDMNWDKEFLNDKHCTIENCSDTSGVVQIKNALGETIKYVDSNCLRKAKISNNFGQTNVYFNNTYVSTEGAVMEINSSFGETNIYVPAVWRTEVKRSNSFGNITEHGKPSTDGALPLVTIKADNSFGEINIYFF